MLIRLRLSLALTLLLFGFSLNEQTISAQETSKPPIPSPRKDSQPQQPHASESNTQSQEDQRGTKNKPIVVEILQPPIDAAHTEKKPEKSDTQPPEDKTVEKVSAALNALASVVMAAFTICLWWTAKKQWEATVVAAKAAERSADAAHKTLAVAQRAFVFTKNINHGININTRGRENVIDHIFFWADVENVGLTPATHVETWMQFETVPWSVRTVPAFHKFAHEDESYSALGPRVTYGTTQTAIPIAKIMECWNHQIRIYLYARIEYRDIFDPAFIHHHEQCVQLDIISNPSSLPPQNGPDPQRFRYRVCGPQNTTG